MHKPRDFWTTESMHSKENKFMLMIHPFLILRNLLLSCTTTNVFALQMFCKWYACHWSECLSWIYHYINNTNQELGYNVNNIRNKTCWTTLFWSCSWAMTEPILVKLHCCHCHHQPERKGWEYMSVCWLLSLVDSLVVDGHLSCRPPPSQAETGTRLVPACGFYGYYG